MMKLMFTLTAMTMAVLPAVAADPAEQVLLNNLKRSQATYGATDSRTGEMLFSVGNFYHKKKDYGREASYFDQAMKIFQTKPGKNSEMLRYYSDALGRVFLEEGKLDKSESMFKRALALGEKLAPREQTYVVPHTLDGVAQLYVAQERYPEAESALKRRIELRKRFMNSGQVDLANVDLAVLYTRWGKLDQAQEVFNQLNTIYPAPKQVKAAYRELQAKLPLQKPAETRKTPPAMDTNKPSTPIESKDSSQPETSTTAQTSESKPISQ